MTSSPNPAGGNLLAPLRGAGRIEGTSIPVVASGDGRNHRLPSGTLRVRIRIEPELEEPTYGAPGCRFESSRS